MVGLLVYFSVRVGTLASSFPGMSHMWMSLWPQAWKISAVTISTLALDGEVCQRERSAAALELYFSSVLVSSAGRVSVLPPAGKQRHRAVIFLWGLVAFQGRGKGSTWNTCAPPPLMEPQQCAGYRRNLLCREAGRQGDEWRTSSSNRIYSTSYSTALFKDWSSKPGSGM